jgi:hypothetical protein
MEWLSAPLVPVNRSVNVPRPPPTEVLTVRTDEDAAGTGFTLKDPVAPAGSPLTESATLPLKLPFDATLTLKVVVAPAVIVAEAGVTDSTKSGGCGTIRLTLVERTSAPLVPVILSE